MINIIHSSILCKWANLQNQQNQIIIAPTVYKLFYNAIALVTTVHCFLGGKTSMAGI